MPLPISVVFGSPTPVYRQIMEQICGAIVSGRLAEDETLPTVRALAQQLMINPNTVARSYAELQREGFIESRGVRGMVVSPRRQMYTKSERRRRIDPTLESFVSDALLLGYELDEIKELVDERLEELKRKRNR